MTGNVRFVLPEMAVRRRDAAQFLVWAVATGQDGMRAGDRAHREF